MTRKDNGWDPGVELVTGLPSFADLTDTQKAYAAELFNELFITDAAPISMAEADEVLRKVKEQALTID